MAHTFTSLNFHIIFSTKERRAQIGAALKPDLSAYIGGIIRALNGVAHIVNGTADHAHLLARIPAALSIAEFVKKVKANSTGWVRQERHQRLFAWQEGYFAFSVSKSNLQAVYEYIANQEEHHRRVCFEDELLLLLKKHEIDYDEQYLWG